MTIFIDMDDVLADTFGMHIKMYNEEFNENLSIQDISTGEVWQNVPKERRKSIAQHAWTEGFFTKLEPMKDSIAIMEELYAKYEVYIASAATQFPNSLTEKCDWLAKYFPFITWEHQIMCGHKFILRGDLLIDDRTLNLDKFVGDTLLFTSPHNNQEEGYERVASWKEIAEKLL